MKRRLLKIVSAATALAAALTFNISSALADSPTDKTTGAVVVTEEMLEKHNAYVEAYNTAYEKALEEEMADIDEAMMKEMEKIQRGEYVDDPHIIRRKNAEERAKAECEKLGLASNTFELTAYQNSLGQGWYGTFILPSNVSSNSITFFNPPKYFNCKTGGRYASITPISGYSGNLKSVSINITYTDGTTGHAYKKGNEAMVSEYVTGSYDKTIERVTYNFTLLQGDGFAADTLEYANITLISG